MVGCRNTDSTSLNLFRRSRPFEVVVTTTPEGVSLLWSMPFFSIESSASLRTVQARFALYMILVRFISLSSATTFMMSMKTSSLDLRIIARVSWYERYLSFLGAFPEPGPPKLWNAANFGEFKLGSRRKPGQKSRG